MTTAIPALWSTLIVLYIIVSGLVQLRASYPAYVYSLYAVVWCYLVFQYFKWMRHMFGWGAWSWETWTFKPLSEYGAVTWYEDVTVEKTYPGMVRCFSLDYWSMLYACLLWLVMDTSGGWGALWTIFTSACPQLCFAVHCTLSSQPAQMKYVYSKAGEEGRKVLGEINPNISFMTNSIIGVFVILVPEIAAFLYHKNGMNLGIYAAQAWIAVALLGE